MSNSDKRRKANKKQKLEDEKPKWYYDACALDLKLSYGEIINKYPKSPVISHLALGEAYGCCLIKGQEAANDFLEFITKLKDNGYLAIIGNDGVDNVFDDIRNNFSLSLSITDLIHLATAIHNRCNIFKTADPDFNIPKQKIHELGKKYSLNFSISVIKL